MAELAGIFQKIHGQHTHQGGKPRAFISLDSSKANSDSPLEQGINHLNNSSPQIQSFNDDDNGTGFFISPNGLLMTKAHVVAGKSMNKSTLNKFIYESSRFDVEFPDTTKMQFQLIAYDIDKDLALLKPANGTQVATPYFFKLSGTDAELGDAINLIGKPGSKDENQISRGKVLTANQVENLLRETHNEHDFGDSSQGQIDTIMGTVDDYMNSGSLVGSYLSEGGASGGSVLNDNGEVVGVHSNSLRTGLDFIFMMMNRGEEPPWFRPSTATKSSQVLDFLAQRAKIDTNKLLDGNEV